MRDGSIEGIQDGFSLFGRVELEIVELFDCLAIAVEGFSPVEEAEVLGVGTQLVLQHLAHMYIYIIVRIRS